MFRKSTLEDIALKKGVLEIIEEKYDFQFDEIYKQFVLAHEIGQYLESVDSYLDQFLRPTPIQSRTLKVESLSLFYNWLSSPFEVLYSLKYYDRVEELLKNIALVRIGDIVDKGGLFIGVGKDNKGEIFSYRYGIDQKPIFVCRDMNQILNCLEVKFKSSVEGLYKKANERYWLKKGLEFKINEKALIPNQSIATECSSLNILLSNMKKEVLQCIK